MQTCVRAVWGYDCLSTLRPLYRCRRPSPSPMQTLEPDDAILRTLLYADVFDYPLTPVEIHHYLIASPTDRPAPPEVIEAALRSSPRLARQVTRVNGYVTLRDREAIGALRDERRRNSARLWPQDRKSVV